MKESLIQFLACLGVILFVSILLILTITPISPPRSEPVVPTTTTQPWGTPGDRIDP